MAQMNATGQKFKKIKNKNPIKRQKLDLINMRNTEVNVKEKKMQNMAATAKADVPNSQVKQSVAIETKVDDYLFCAVGNRLTPSNLYLRSCEQGRW